MMVIDGGELECFQEAMSYVQTEKWLKAMQKEIKSPHKNRIFEFAELPKDKRVLKNKWVFRLKTEEKSLPLRYKA